MSSPFATAYIGKKVVITLNVDSSDDDFVDNYYDSILDNMSKVETNGNIITGVVTGCDVSVEYYGPQLVNVNLDGIDSEISSKIATISAIPGVVSVEIEYKLVLGVELDRN